MRYVEVTDEYVYRRENTLLESFSTSKATYFPEVIAVESTKRCRAVSRNFVYIPEEYNTRKERTQTCLVLYPKLTIYQYDNGRSSYVILIDMRYLYF